MDDKKDDSIDAVLTERGARYGSFMDHAGITQHLKDSLYTHAAIHGVQLSASQKEALDMICHKLGRIVNGDPNYADSWVDIAGYAKLEANILQGDIK